MTYHWIYKQDSRNRHVYNRKQLHVSPNVEIALGLDRKNAEQYAAELTRSTGKRHLVVSLPEGTAAPKKCIPTINA